MQIKLASDSTQQSAGIKGVCTVFFQVFFFEEISGSQ